MIGAIIGDIVGSRFEFDNIKTKDFELFTEECFFTDDTVMTLAVAKALMNNMDEDGKICMDELSTNVFANMQALGRKYPDAGYGGRFFWWIFGEDKSPYNSFGNGAAMRVSACGDAADSISEAMAFAEAVTELTHNHPEGLKGAKATAAAIYLARTGVDKAEIKKYICENFYEIKFTLDDIRDTYEFNETCQDTVPQALEAFFESEDFEDAIRNGISIGGDSDTIGAITGAVAEAFYGIPKEISEKAMGYLDDNLRKIVEEWYERKAEHYYCQK